MVLTGGCKARVVGHVCDVRAGRNANSGGDAGDDNSCTVIIIDVNANICDDRIGFNGGVPLLVTVMVVKLTLLRLKAVV